MAKRKSATESMHIAFVLDRSGSMSSIWDDVKGGFKTFIKEQQKLGDPKFTLTTFDTEYDTVYDATPIKDVKPVLDSKRVYPRGATALLDAVAHTINLISALPVEPTKVMVVIFTDGEENSSKEYTNGSLGALVNTKKDAGWGFLFLGADQDAFTQGRKFGMGAGQTVSFNSAQAGSSSGTIARSSTATADYLYHGKAVDVDPTYDVDAEKKKKKVTTP